jgi:hypothetical protein
MAQELKELLRRVKTLIEQDATPPRFRRPVTHFKIAHQFPSMLRPQSFLKAHTGSFRGTLQSGYALVEPYNFKEFQDCRRFLMLVSRGLWQREILCRSNL